MHLPLLTTSLVLSLSVLSNAATFNDSGGYIPKFMASVDPTLADILNKTNITTTETGARIFTVLASGGNCTLIIPNGDDLAAVNTSDVEAFAELLSYHILCGDFSDHNWKVPALEGAPSPNHTIGRTLLNSSSYVTLEGNKSQVLAWTRDDSTGKPQVDILNQATNVTIFNCTTFLNILACPATAVLLPPGNLTTVLNSTKALYGLNSAQGFLDSVLDDSGRSLSEVLMNSTGCTLFLPNDDAFTSAEAAFTTMANNTMAMVTVFRNHVLNGTTVYSPFFSPTSNFTTAAGQPLTFDTSDSGPYISLSNGHYTSNILQSDILLSNGVIHVVDRVMLDMASNSDAANSAYSSAVSSASANPTTETAALGPATSVTGTTTGNDGEALRVRMGENRRMVVTGFVGVIVWAAIGAYVI